MVAKANDMQIKVSVDPEIGANFKKTCADANEVIRTVLAQFMADYSNSEVKRVTIPDYSTRRRRRAAVKKIIKQLEALKDREEICRDNIPENLLGSSVYDVAEEAVSSLEEAIETLSSFWMVP